MSEITTHHGPDVLPWFQKPAETDENHQPGTRLFTFSDYNLAPEGTKVRRGRKGNTSGAILTKSGSAWWDYSEPSQPGTTAYGMEGRATYVIDGSEL